MSGVNRVIAVVFAALMVFMSQMSFAASRKHYAYGYRVKGHYYRVLTHRSAHHYKKRGIASWYGPGFQGRRAANGKRYNMYAMTAASKVLPLGSMVKVTNLRNHRSVIVKITDRGPFVGKRIIDLSYLAAKKLHSVSRGAVRVEVATLT